MASRRKRYGLAGAALLLGILGAGWLARTYPLAAGAVLLVIGGALAYLLGYYVTRKAGRIRKGHRNRLIGATLLLIGLLFLMPLLGTRAGEEPSWPIVGFACMALVSVHLAGRALGQRRKRTKFPLPESALAHKYLDGLKGLEIGGSIHNPFGLDAWNIDYTASTNTRFKKAELKISGRTRPVDIVAMGDRLPILDETQGFVVTSHVLEHFPDPIKALKEWYRVIKPGGYIFMIVPYKERTFDRKRPRTRLAELIQRHEIGQCAGTQEHHSVWITEDVAELVTYLGWTIVEVQDVDDKAGNGFTVVIQKRWPQGPGVSGARSAGRGGERGMP